ncbi:MAG: hypothetical protein ACI9ON_003325 [Limisphaerales bacterium]|jgi:hypothetical protein
MTRIRSPQRRPLPVPLKMLAKPYLAYEDNIMRAPYVNNSYKWSGGGFVSTPKDLVKLGLVAAFATNVISLSPSPGEREQIRALAILFGE